MYKFLFATVPQEYIYQHRKSHWRGKFCWAFINLAILAVCLTLAKIASELFAIQHDGATFAGIVLMLLYLVTAAYMIGFNLWAMVWYWKNYKPS